MTIKLNITSTVFALASFFMLIACDDAPPVKKQSVSNVISKKVSQPAAQIKSSPKDEKKDKKNLKKEAALPAMKTEKILKKANALSIKSENLDEFKADHYDSLGKIDPFRPLIQEKSEDPVAFVDKRPKRILTPLEKIELSQIRLVAVIIMKGRQIAMVEEANGKGYEVGIGTYMGKNQGRVFKIKKNSIMIKELAKDFKGQLKEKVQEIKLYKNDSEE